MRVPGGPSPLRKRGGRTLRQSITRRLFKEEVKAEVLGRVRAADRETIKTALNVAYDLSSGPWSSAALARKPFPNHPFAQARPNAAFDPGMINVQSGKFRVGWEIKDTAPDDAPVLWNTSKVGKFLESGTRRMVARPIDKKIMQIIDPIRRRNLERAFSDGTFASRPATILRPAAS